MSRNGNGVGVGVGGDHGGVVGAMGALFATSTISVELSNKSRLTIDDNCLYTTVTQVTTTGRRLKKIYLFPDANKQVVEKTLYKICLC